MLPPQIEVQRVDSHQLEAIRRQWKAKELLLNKNPLLPKSKDTPPPDAKYLSDRNIRVKKEQRSRSQDVLPRQSAPLSQLGISKAQSGADQAIRDQQLPQGSENLLNSQESVYYSFYARLYEAIAPIWQSRIREVPFRRRILPGDYSTQVIIVLDQFGNLLQIYREQSSGVREFDEAVNQSWQKIERFPNPPRGLLNSKNQVQIGWVFTVQVNPGARLQYLPPERLE